MNLSILSATAKAMVAPGKGVLAADESDATCKKRFDSVNVECTEENRRQYREMLLGAPGLEQYVSGIILHEETINQSASDGTPFPKLLEQKGILPGIKVDKGSKALALHAGEEVTEGLDKLRERLAEFSALGAKFAKWRAVINIGNGIPSGACLTGNAHALARYAALCQEADIVPMVEPEIIIEGDHSIERCYEETKKMMQALYRELGEQGVALEGTIMKVSMVIAGKKAAQQSTPKEVAAATVKLLKETVPSNLAGVVFLSGGQGDEQATENLDEMNKMGKLSWPLSFSYARSIQNPVLKIWAQDLRANVDKARAALIFRAKMNSLASLGQYDKKLEEGRPY